MMDQATGSAENTSDFRRSGRGGSPLGGIEGWWHAQSLARQFALAASVIILAGTLAVGFWVAARIKQGVAETSAASAFLYVDNVVSPWVHRLGTARTFPPEDAAEIDRVLKQWIGTRITSLNIWTRDNYVAYSTRKEIVGRQFPPTANFTRALGGEIAAEFEGHPHVGDAHDRAPEMRLEIYAPVFRAGSDEVIGVVELYSIREGLAAELRRATQLSWIVVGAIGLAMMAALSGIVFRGSRTIDHQEAQLRTQISHLVELLDQNAELSRRLERSRQRTVAINEQQLRRIGADLHDGPAQLIGMSLLMLDTPTDGPDGPAAAADASERVRGALTEALREIRNISTGLILPELEQSRLDDVVRQAVRRHEARTRSNVAVTVAAADYEVPLPLKVCVYRFLQEALSNSWRHAEGKGQRISLTRDRDQLTISASDQGQGLRGPDAVGILSNMVPQAKRDGMAATDDGADASSGLGLIGLKDRVEALGGTLALRSTGDGTTVTCTFDLQQIQKLAHEQA